MPKTLILIPSRMSATRLPGKPLLKINNLSIPDVNDINPILLSMENK